MDGQESAAELAASYFRLMERGELLMEVGRWREAITEFEKHLAEFPDTYWALCKSAVCYMSLGELQTALDVTKRAIAVDPYDEWAYRLQSTIYSESGEPQRALEAAKIAIEKDPSSPETIRCLFWAQAGAVKLVDAEKTLASLREAMPDAADTHEAAGYLSLKRGNNLEAERHYLESLKIEPESVNAMNNLGVVYLNLYQAGQGIHYKKMSLEMFERAVRMQPTFKLGQENIKAASTALKFRLPFGGFFLIWMAIKLAGSFAAPSTGRLTRASEAGRSDFGLATESYLLTGVNFYALLLFLACVATAIACISPKHREAVLYQLAVPRTWLMIVVATAIPAILYIIGLRTFDNAQTPFVSIAFLFCAALTIIALVNGFQVWRARRV